MVNPEEETEHHIDWSDSDDSNDELAQSKETRCSYCYKILSSHSQIPKHEKTCDLAINCTARKVTCKDGSFKFICDICCRTYKYANSLVDHEKRHEPPGGFICKYCNGRFCTEVQLEQHTEETHKVYKCQICKETFDTASNYVDHIKIMHNGQDKLYHVCEECGRQFSSLNVLKFHKETKCGTLRPFKCDKCTKTFKTKYLLKAHDLLHLEGKQYCCSFCGNKFATKAALQRHERRHTGERPFKCELCTKTFAYGESLVTHSSVHTGIKPYLCECCGSRFSCTGNLLAHRRKRPGTCGQPQYCTKLAKACPRPSIKTNESTKSLVIKAHKVLKDDEMKKIKQNKMKRRRRPASLQNLKTKLNQINVKHGNENSLSQTKAITTIETPIVKDSVIENLKLEDVPSPNDWLILNDTDIDTNPDDKLKVEILEYEFVPDLNLKTDSVEEYSLSVKSEENIVLDIDYVDSCLENTMNPLNSEENTDLDAKLLMDESSKEDVENSGENATSNFTCRVCKKTYKFFKSFQSHLRLHEYVTNKKNSSIEKKRKKSANDKEGETNINSNDNKNGNEFDGDSSNSNSNSNNSNENSVKKEQRNRRYSIELNQLEECENDDDDDDDDDLPLTDSQRIQFECLDCRNKIFNTKSSYVRHLRNIHKKKSSDIWNLLLASNEISDESSNDLRCKICGKLYSFKKTLQKHLKVHGPDGNLTHMCRCCNKYFSSPEEVQVHTTTNHKSEITCTICNKVYKDAELLQAHKRYSHSDDPNGKPKKYTFICNKCGRTLSSRTALTNHELSDCGKDPIHKCNVCGKGLHSAGSLKSHMLIHSGSLMFKCEYCDRRFARKGQCQIHERKHTGEKPFPCTYCAKAFAYRENLLIHISTHTGLKRYMCNSCGERFSCVTGLKAHWRTHATTCGSDPNRSTKASGVYLGFQKGQLVHTKEPTESVD